MVYAWFASVGVFFGATFGMLVMYIHGVKRFDQMEKKYEVVIKRTNDRSYEKGWEDAIDYIKRGGIVEAAIVE